MMEINQIRWVGGLLVGGSAAYWAYRNNVWTLESEGNWKNSLMLGWAAGAITGVFIVPIVLLPLYMTGIMKI